MMGSNGNYTKSSPQRNPKGCKKVAGGRSPRRPPGKSLVMTAPRRVCRKKDFLCVTLWNLRASVVKLLREINHRGTEIPQSYTARGRPAPFALIAEFLQHVGLLYPVINVCAIPEQYATASMQPGNSDSL